jgi:hypothetical protein
MKKIAFSIFLLSITTLIYGQNFTLSELIELNNYKLDDFDTYVTQKGYKFDEVDNNDFADETTYAFYVKGVKKAYISKFHYHDDNSNMITFQTTNAATYLKVKSDLKKLGFKFTETKVYNESQFLIYKKGKIKVSLISIVLKNNYGDITSYEISITKYD